MTGLPTVLLVDRGDETAAVLRAALAGRAALSHLRGLASGGMLPSTVAPSILVLDLESESDWNDPAVLNRCVKLAGENVPLLLIGSLRAASPFLRGDRIDKPYHYAELVRRIEAYLGQLTAWSTHRGVVVRHPRAGSGNTI